MAPDAEASVAVRKRDKKEKGKGKEVQPQPADLSSLPSKTRATGDGPYSSNATTTEELPPSWSWTILADSETSKCPPVFTKDAKYFFIASGPSVKIYSVSTTRVISTLHIESPSNSPSSSQSTSTPSRPVITSLLINPSNPFQLVTASADGQIRIWDFLDAVLLKSIDSGLCHISNMAASKHLKDHVLVLGKKKSAGKLHLYRVSISLLPVDESSSSASPTREQYHAVGLGDAPISGLAISPSGSHIVITADKIVRTIGTNDFHGSSVRKYDSPDPLTCLAFHPSEELFATGDKNGVIRLWYCLDPRNIARRGNSNHDRRTNRAPTTVMHWHAHAVSSIAFTANGSYLLSGGEEAVLVIWQLQNGHREFLPRLGAPIDHITILPQSAGAAHQGYLVSLADGGMSLVDSASLSVSRTFIQFKQPSTPSTQSNPQVAQSTPLAIHPRTSHLILPSSHASSLQIYSPSSQELLAEVEISSSNRVSRRNDLPLEQARVTHVAVSPKDDKCMWMATVDFREGGNDFGNEIVLKIWKWLPGVANGGSGSWVLNTRIDRPHDQDGVTALQFSPARLQISDDSGDGLSQNESLLLTSGENGVLRTWKPQVVRDGKNGEEDVYWVPRSSFSYRSQRVSNALWSPDASLIAVAHGPSVTIWESLNNALLCNLTTPVVATASTLCFLGPSGRYLATSSRKCDVVLWDLVTRSIVWTHRVPFKGPMLMIPHPENDSFAVVVCDGAAKGAVATRTLVHIFGTRSSQPLRSYTLPFSLRHAIWYPTASSPPIDTTKSTPLYSLLAITTGSTTVIIGDEEILSATPSVGSSARAIGPNAAVELRPTLFQDIFGKSAFPALEIPSITRTRKPVEDEITSLGSGTKCLDLTLLDGPAHLLPPISSLFDSLIGSFTNISTPASSSTQSSVPIEDFEEGERTANLEKIEGDSKGKIRRDVGTPHARHGARKITDEELSVFAELFRTVLAVPSNTKPMPSKHGDGNGLPNGKAVNGTHASTHATNGKLKASRGSLVPSSSPATPSGKILSSKYRKPISPTQTITTTPLTSHSQKNDKLMPAHSPATGQKRKKATA